MHAPDARQRGRKGAKGQPGQARHGQHQRCRRERAEEHGAAGVPVPLPPGLGAPRDHPAALLALRLCSRPLRLTRWRWCPCCICAGASAASAAQAPRQGAARAQPWALGGKVAGAHDHAARCDAVGDGREEGHHDGAVQLAGITFRRPQLVRPAAVQHGPARQGTLGQGLLLLWVLWCAKAGWAGVRCWPCCMQSCAHARLRPPQCCCTAQCMGWVQRVQRADCALPARRRPHCRIVGPQNWRASRATLLSPHTPGRDVPHAPVCRKGPPGLLACARLRCPGASCTQLPAPACSTRWPAAARWGGRRRAHVHAWGQAWS